eukprot:COSAG06_NODE_825_length_12067_cov_4.396975_9_plen_1674_part_00
MGGLQTSTGACSVGSRPYLGAVRVGLRRAGSTQPHSSIIHSARANHSIIHSVRSSTGGLSDLAGEAEAMYAEAEMEVAVTFTEAGTLGLKLTPNKQTGKIELLQVNPGTQAERHSQLSAGLILQSVAGASVAGKGYQEVLGMIKAGGRPLSMTFAPGGTVATSPRASKKPAPRQPPAPSDATAGLTGKAAHEQRARREEKRKALAGSRTSPTSTSPSGPLRRVASTTSINTLTRTRTGSGSSASRATASGGGGRKVTRPYKAEVAVGLWIAVVGKTAPAKLLVDNRNGSWKVEYANKGGEATVQERSMKPCTHQQKRVVDKIKVDEAVGGGTTAVVEQGEAVDSDGNTSLHLACAGKAATEVVLALVERYPHLSEKANGLGDHALHIACANSTSESVISALLKQWPHACEKQNKAGDCPLHILLRKLLSDQITADVFLTLLQKWPKEKGEAVDSNGNTSLHLACAGKAATEVILALLERYPHLSEKANGLGDHALHIACANGASESVISPLLKQWPDACNKQNKAGDCPLHIACANSTSESVISALLKQWPDACNKQNKAGDCPLHILLRKLLSDQITADVFLTLLQKWPKEKGEAVDSDGDDTGVADGEDEPEEQPEPDEDPYPPLPDDPQLAVVELRRRIAQAGGQVQKWPKEKGEAVDSNGNTSLHLACAGKAATEVILALLKRYPHLIEKANGLGDHALHIACANGASESVISALMQQWPDACEKQNKAGDCPLHIACANGASESVISPLMKQWPHACNKQNKAGDCPLHILLRKLLSDQITADVFLTLLQKWPKEKGEAVDSNGNTSLHLACDGEAATEVILALLKRYPRLSKRSNTLGDYPLHLACKTRKPLDVISELLRSAKLYPQSQRSCLTLSLAAGADKGVLEEMKSAALKQGPTAWKLVLMHRDKKGMDALQCALQYAESAFTDRLDRHRCLSNLQWVFTVMAESDLDAMEAELAASATEEAVTAQAAAAAAAQTEGGTEYLPVSSAPPRESELQHIHVTPARGLSRIDTEYSPKQSEEEGDHIEEEGDHSRDGVSVDELRRKLLRYEWLLNETSDQLSVFNMKDTDLQKRLLLWLSGSDYAELAEQNARDAFELNMYEALVFNCCRFATNASRGDAIDEFLDAVLDAKYTTDAKQPVVHLDRFNRDLQLMDQVALDNSNQIIYSILEKNFKQQTGGVNFNNAIRKLCTYEMIAANDDNNQTNCTCHKCKLRVKHSKLARLLQVVKDGGLPVVDQMLDVAVIFDYARSGNVRWAAMGIALLAMFPFIACVQDARHEKQGGLGSKEVRRLDEFPWWCSVILNFSQTRMVWETYVAVQLRGRGYECPIALHNMALVEHAFEAIPQTTFQFFVLGSDLACGRHISAVRYVSVLFSLRAVLQVTSLPKAGKHTGSSWLWTLLFALLQLVHSILRFGALVLFALALDQHVYAVGFGCVSLVAGGLVYVALEVLHSRWVAPDSALLSDELRDKANTTFAFFFSSWIAFFLAAEVGASQRRWDNIVLSPASLQISPPNVLIFTLRLMETYWLLMNGLDTADVFDEDSRHGCTSTSSWNATTEHSESGDYSGSGNEYQPHAGSKQLTYVVLAVELCLYLTCVIVPRRKDGHWFEIVKTDKCLGLLWSRPIYGLFASLVALYVFGVTCICCNSLSRGGADDTGKYSVPPSV